MFFLFLHVGFDVEFLLSFLASSRLCDHSLGSDRGGGDRNTNTYRRFNLELKSLKWLFD